MVTMVIMMILMVVLMIMSIMIMLLVFKHATNDRLAKMIMMRMIIKVMVSFYSSVLAMTIFGANKKLHLLTKIFFKIHLLERRRSWVEHWQAGIPHLWQPLASVGTSHQCDHQHHHSDPD